MEPSVVLVALLVVAFVAIGVAVSRASRGSRGSDTPARLPEGDVLARIRQLLGEGKKIQAIKELRESQPGLGLKDAKEMVEAIEAGHEPGVRFGSPPVGAGQAPSGEVLARIRQLLGEGKKIQAIKELRESQRGLGLKDAKEMVEAIEAGHEPAPAATAAGSVAEPPAVPPAAARTDLAARARELRDSGQETLAIRLICDETGMGILDAQKFVRSLG